MINGFSLGESETPCPYLQGRVFTSENYLIDELSEQDIDLFLERGYRHFGRYFFRPVCTGCGRCLPIRIILDNYRLSRNARRLFRKNSSLDVSLNSNPEAAGEYYRLYRNHKKRFPKDLGEEEEKSGDEGYSQFTESFFYNFSFSKTMEIRDGEKLVAVTHLDVGQESVSAIYCYYDTGYLSLSPGRFSIYRGIEMAKELGKKYYYLGYYIEDNPHMSYKGAYKPNEVLLKEGMWVPGPGIDYRFFPEYRLV